MNTESKPIVVRAGWHDCVADKAGGARPFDRSRGGFDAWAQVMKLTASDGPMEDSQGHTGFSITDGPAGWTSSLEYVFQTPFFIDGFELGTTESWDSATDQ